MRMLCVVCVLDCVHDLRARGRACVHASACVRASLRARLCGCARAPARCGRRGRAVPGSSRAGQVTAGHGRITDRGTLTMRPVGCQGFGVLAPRVALPRSARPECGSAGLHAAVRLRRIAGAPPARVTVLLTGSVGATARAALAVCARAGVRAGVCAASREAVCGDAQAVLSLSVPVPELFPCRPDRSTEAESVCVCLFVRGRGAPVSDGARSGGSDMRVRAFIEVLPIRHGQWPHDERFGPRLAGRAPVPESDSNMITQ